jgi:branched-subunit amino acid aminotransferase/4-amino-4-deoxychorismate lyase
VPPELAARGVFESILAQHGRPLRLADHLARLGRSVRELYGSELPDDVMRRVLTEAAGSAGPRTALRIHVRPSSGVVDVAVTARRLGRRLEVCTLARAMRRDVCWRYKWADRAELQAAEEQTAPALPYFLDPAGRLAETSRGNLFVRGNSGIWKTPPATDHLLPGVTRRALLDVLTDRGVTVDVAPVTAEDLHAASSAIWTSSLSGAVAITSLDGRPLDMGGPWMEWSDWLGFDSELGP